MDQLPYQHGRVFQLVKNNYLIDHLIGGCQTGYDPQNRTLTILLDRSDSPKCLVITLPDESLPLQLGIIRDVMYGDMEPFCGFPLFNFLHDEGWLAGIPELTEEKYQSIIAYARENARMSGWPPDDHNT